MMMMMMIMTPLSPTQVMDDENESLKEMLGNSGSTLAGLQRVSGSIPSVFCSCSRPYKKKNGANKAQGFHGRGSSRRYVEGRLVKGKNQLTLHRGVKSVLRGDKEG